MPRTPSTSHCLLRLFPTFSLAAGSYTGTQTVSISDSSAGATIYYTTNGSTPTTSSAVYTGPVSIVSTSTLQAIAAASNLQNSAVHSALYTIVNPRTQPPTFVLPGGTYNSQQMIVLADSTPGAVIYYTTNQTTPTTNSTV